MKNLHRGKAIEAYNGARVVLKEGNVYSSYMLLKEATRSTLAYINEDIQDKKYSDKTKLATLIADMPKTVVEKLDVSVFDIFVKMDKEGLGAIMSLEIEELMKVKKVLKKLMGTYLAVRL